jgi:hypothetical protein
MKTADLLVDFIESLGYNINLIEVPSATPSNPHNDKIISFIAFRHGRDGEMPKNRPKVPNWCTIDIALRGRPRILVTIDLLQCMSDPHSSRTLYLDDPNVFTDLTVFLDHWYFRVFQQD